eukprot:1697989-Alexandrium_andersonii.AAC.1
MSRQAPEVPRPRGDGPDNAPTPGPGPQGPRAMARVKDPPAPRGPASGLRRRRRACPPRAEQLGGGAAAEPPPT